MNADLKTYRERLNVLHTALQAQQSTVVASLLTGLGQLQMALKNDMAESSWQVIGAECERIADEVEVMTQKLADAATSTTLAQAIETLSAELTDCVENLQTRALALPCPADDGFNYFLEQGLSPLPGRYQLPQPSCVLLYAQPEEAQARERLTAWLDTLKHTLTTAQVVQLGADNENTQLEQAEMVIVICTPELVKQTAVGDLGKPIREKNEAEYRLAQAKASRDHPERQAQHRVDSEVAEATIKEASGKMASTLADESRFMALATPLQQQLFKLRQRHMQAKKDGGSSPVFLLLCEGDRNNQKNQIAVPTAFLDAEEFMVPNAKGDKHEEALTSLSDPVGLIPSAWQLSGHPEAQAQYERWLNRYHSTKADKTAEPDVAYEQSLALRKQFESRWSKRPLKRQRDTLTPRLTLTTEQGGLLANLADFVDKPEITVLNLQGPHGSGKTDSVDEWMAQHWRRDWRYDEQAEQPIRIDLEQHKTVDEALTAYGFNPQDLRHPEAPKLLFVFDNASTQRLSLYRDNHLEEFGTNGARAIVLSDVHPDASAALAPPGQAGQHKVRILTVQALTPEAVNTLMYQRTQLPVEHPELAQAQAYETLDFDKNPLTTPGAVQKHLAPFITTAEDAPSEANPEIVQRPRRVSISQQPGAILNHFLRHGIQAFRQSAITRKPVCFISYAWEPRGQSLTDLQAWLRTLQTRLGWCGFEVKLDITNMQNTIANYMAHGVERADVILLIDTPKLAERANEGQFDMNQLSRDNLTGLNNLQKELWHIGQRLQSANPPKVCRLLPDVTCVQTSAEGLGGFLTPDDFPLFDFNTPDTFIGTSGLLHHLWDLANQPDKKQDYHRLLTHYQQSPMAEYRKAQTLLSLKQRFAFEAKNETLHQTLAFFVAPNGQETANSTIRHPFSQLIENFMLDFGHRLNMMNPQRDLI